MTLPQYRMLKAIRDLTARSIAPPTLRELRIELGLASINAVWEVLDRLAKRGLIQKVTFSPRMIALTPSGLEAIRNFEDSRNEALGPVSP